MSRHTMKSLAFDLECEITQLGIGCYRYADELRKILDLSFSLMSSVRAGLIERLTNEGRSQLHWALLNVKAARAMAAEGDTGRAFNVHEAPKGEDFWSQVLDRSAKAYREEQEQEQEQELAKR